MNVSVNLDCRIVEPWGTRLKETTHGGEMQLRVENDGSDERSVMKVDVQCKCGVAKRVALFSQGS